MEDDELAQIRAQRMAQLQQQGGGGGGEQAVARQQQMAQQRQQQEEQTNSILSQVGASIEHVDLVVQVLDQNARARLANIAAANAGKARQLEGMIVQMARQGRIPGKLNDDTFKGLLDQARPLARAHSEHGDRAGERAEQVDRHQGEL